MEDGIEWSYNIIVCNEVNAPFTLFITTTENLVEKYKDCLISKQEIFTWPGGAISMSNIIGVYK